MRRDDRERLKGGGGDLFVVPCEGLDRRMIAHIPYLRERDREREREGERERGGWVGRGWRQLSKRVRDSIIRTSREREPAEP